MYYEYYLDLMDLGMELCYPFVGSFFCVQRSFLFLDKSIFWRKT